MNKSILARLIKHRDTGTRKEADKFVKWLNGDGEWQKPFRRLAELTAAQMKRELKRKPRVTTLEAADPYIATERKINRILRAMQKHFPPSELRLAGWRFEDELLLFEDEMIREIKGRDAQLASMLNSFELLANANAFAVFERCALPSCGKYFFAFRRGRRYCSDACQRKHYDESPKRKKKNREYQRDYYRKFLSVAALKKQRGVRTGLPQSAIAERKRITWTPR